MKNKKPTPTTRKLYGIEVPIEFNENIEFTLQHFPKPNEFNFTVDEKKCFTVRGSEFDAIDLTKIIKENDFDINKLCIKINKRYEYGDIEPEVDLIIGEQIQVKNPHYKTLMKSYENYIRILELSKPYFEDVKQAKQDQILRQINKDKLTLYNKLKKELGK